MATAVDPPVEPPTLNEPPLADIPRRRRRIWPWALGSVLLLLVAGAVAAGVYVRGQFPPSKLAKAPQALARVQTRGWDTKLMSVRATADDGSSIPVRTTARGWIWPKGTLTPGESVHIAIVVARPSWAHKLVGAYEHKSITVTAPRAKVLTHWIQTRHGKPVQVRFSTPVRSVTVWRGDKVAKQKLASPQAHRLAAALADVVGHRQHPRLRRRPHLGEPVEPGPRDLVPDGPAARRRAAAGARQVAAAQAVPHPALLATPHDGARRWHAEADAGRAGQLAHGR